MANPIAYVAHQFGGDPKNLDAAEAWLRFLIQSVRDIDFCAPWITWCRVLTDGDFRARGLAFDCEMAIRCDWFVMCGPHKSAGMLVELHAVFANRQRPILIVDLVPHEIGSDETLTILQGALARYKNDGFGT